MSTLTEDLGQDDEEEGQMISALVAWWAYRQGQRSARRQAFRHLTVVAHALYTGSTGAYHLTPDLPREDDSTNVNLTAEGWSESN